MTMRRLTCHPCVFDGFYEGVVFVSFGFNVWGCVSILWMIRWGIGICGLGCSYDAPGMYLMYGLSLARHVHLVVRHEHGYPWRDGGLLSILPMFVSAWCLVWIHDLSRLANWWVVSCFSKAFEEFVVACR